MEIQICKSYIFCLKWYLVDCDKLKLYTKILREITESIVKRYSLKGNIGNKMKC